MNWALRKFKLLSTLNFIAVLMLFSGCISKSQIDIQLMKKGAIGSDTTKPVLSASFSLGAVPDDLSKTPTINFGAGSDNSSGIDYYEVRLLDNQGGRVVLANWAPIVSGTRIENISPLLQAGHPYVVQLRANDKAGNYSDSIQSNPWNTPVAASVAFFSSQMVSAQENSGAVNVQVVLSQARSVDTNVAFSYAGTATVNTDYNFTNSIFMTIPAGDTSANLVVQLIDDNVSEAIEYIDLTLDASSNPLITLGSPTAKRIYIEDDELQNSAMIASGANHNCYKDSAGRVKCWGRNNWGQLGYGDTNNRGDGPSEMGVNLPYVNLGTNVTALKISAGNGGDNTCALTSNGRVKCWGRGDNWSEPGYMGYGHPNNIGDQANQMGDNLPFINLGTNVVAKDIVTSSFNSCVFTADNRAKCWGTGFHGANGNASDNRVGSSLNDMGDNLPYLDLGTGRKVLKIAMGSFHRCAILDNLKVKCWGWNTAGELGYEDLVTRGDDPNEMGDNLPYVNLGTNAQIVDIAAATGGYFESGGVHHTCALFSTGQVKCWGANGAGQLGYGNTTSVGSTAGSMGDNLAFVDLGAGRTAKQIFASNFSTCAILDNDKLKCWGSGANGQLGLNNTVNIADNLDITGKLFLPYTILGTKPVVSVSGSFLEWTGGHRCALFNDSSVKCWGLNAYGELGVGNTLILGDEPGEMESLDDISLF